MNRKVKWSGQPTPANPSGTYTGDLIRVNDSETSALVRCNETGADVWIPCGQLSFEGA